MIYGTERELSYPPDFCVGPFWIYRRPHLTEFLEAAAQWFALAVWSSATSDYVAAVARKILPAQLSWQFVWGRERCTERLDPEHFDMAFIKDLKKVDRLGFDRRRVLCVDDTPAKLARNYGNAIYVAPFEGDRNDIELRRLLEYLGTARDVDDYRRVEKRGWRQGARAKGFGGKATQ